MAEAYDKWVDDLPQQFKDKHNIDVFIKAFSRQINDLYDVFGELDSRTDLQEASGVNLDYIGTIIPLTRKEAGVMTGMDNSEPVISDEKYRHFLKYKNLLNTSECTYWDIMESVSMLWNTDKFFYAESTERPATIIIKIPLSIGGEIMRAGKTLAIKPSGVKLLYEISFIEDIVINLQESFCMPVSIHRAVFHWTHEGRYLTLINRFKNNTLESFDNTKVTVKKNFWCHDGTFFNDGTKKFNAEIRKEVY